MTFGLSSTSFIMKNVSNSVLLKSTRLLYFYIIILFLLILQIVPSQAEGKSIENETMEIPELLVMNNKDIVDSIELWEQRREEILCILSDNIYGYLPPILSEGKGEIIETVTKCCSGHAILQKVQITVETERGRQFSFPLSLVLPVNNGEKKVPIFLMLNFRPDIYDMYIPTEEIIENGFGIALIYYEDIVPDDDFEMEEKVKNEWEAGLATHFTRPTDGTGFGKISLWAWGASRALDYLMTREEIDNEHIIIAGHSRLGKTALWCAANDDRFYCAISNDSGCAGASIERNHHEGAETVKDIIRFDSWFCENYFKYAENIESMPFDQHYLLAAIAPRLVAVGSASKDKWADPQNELLACIEASPAWEMFGKEGYVGKKWENIKTGDAFIEGNISYHYRDGIHYLGRQDWIVYMEFIKAHMREENE